MPLIFISQEFTCCSFEAIIRGDIPVISMGRRLKLQRSGPGLNFTQCLAVGFWTSPMSSCYRCLTGCHFNAGVYHLVAPVWTQLYVWVHPLGQSPEDIARARVLPTCHLLHPSQPKRGSLATTSARSQPGPPFPTSGRWVVSRRVIETHTALAKQTFPVRGKVLSISAAAAAEAPPCPSRHTWRAPLNSSPQNSLRSVVCKCQLSRQAVARVFS